MFVTGDSDTRVDPAHARKMAALMQADNGSGNPIILRYDTKGGHSGIGSVDKSVDEQVDQMSFSVRPFGSRNSLIMRYLYVLLIGAAAAWRRPCR